MCFSVKFFSHTTIIIIIFFFSCNYYYYYYYYYFHYYYYHYYYYYFTMVSRSVNSNRFMCDDYLYSKIDWHFLCGNHLQPCHFSSESIYHYDVHPSDANLQTQTTLKTRTPHAERWPFLLGTRKWAQLASWAPTTRLVQPWNMPTCSRLSSK